MVFLANLTKVHCFDKLYLMAAVKKTAAATQYKNVLVLHFILFNTSCSYSAHLPGVWQSITTGPGKVVMGYSFFTVPSRDLRLPPSLRDPSVKRGCDWTEVSS